MPKIIHKPMKKRNPVAKALREDGILRSQTIADKRSKQLENEAKKVFMEWKKKKQKLSHMFEQEVSVLLEKKGIQEVLRVHNGQHPYLLKQFLGKKISIETMCILDTITNYSEAWNLMIEETIVYPDVWTRINKYKTFIHFDREAYKSKLIELCSI